VRYKVQMVQLQYIMRYSHSYTKQQQFCEIVIIAIVTLKIAKRRKSRYKLAIMRNIVLSAI